MGNQFGCQCQSTHARICEEALVKKLLSAPPEREPKKADVHTRAAEEQMRLSLGARVQIARRGKGGTVRIDFKSEDDLQRIYERITGK